MLFRSKAAYLEPGADQIMTAGALAEELALAARWTGCNSLSVESRGDLAEELRSRIVAP